LIEDLARTVGRAVVYDHPFQREYGLATDGFDYRLDVLLLVTYRGNDYISRHLIFTLEYNLGLPVFFSP
jgi:hypothetical protein